MSDLQYLVNFKNKEFVAITYGSVISDRTEPYVRSKTGNGLKIDVKALCEKKLSPLPTSTKDFIDENRRELSLLVGNPPWDKDDYEAYLWKEHISEHTCEIWLPRNLVETKGIRDWQSATTYLKELEIYLYEDLDVDSYEKIFRRSCKRYSL